MGVGVGDELVGLHLGASPDRVGLLLGGRHGGVGIDIGLLDDPLHLLAGRLEHLGGLAGPRRDDVLGHP
ncbi:unannotated protein [freshwater metagenome]|uniref:Unannotated protein n=1 Tax=freshwater metagenome TaxID=449393 RepID=A0A6J6EFN8_9ZZZZ